MNESKCCVGDVDARFVGWRSREFFKNSLNYGKKLYIRVYD